MSFVDRLKEVFGFEASLDIPHVNKLAEYDKWHEQQEERLNAARVAVLEGRFKVRYGAAAEQELREQMQSGTTR